MAERYDLIVFDWDGTLLDSASAIVRALIAACRDLGVAEPTEEGARHIIGLGLHDALRLAVPDLAVADYPRVVERYRHHFLTTDRELSLFPGAFEMIEDLAGAGWMLAVATGKSRVGLDRSLSHTGLGEFFQITRCADESFSKPHPAMLEEIMGALGVGRERTLMVGDTTHDLNMANNAAVAGLGVAFGAHPRLELASVASVGIVDTPAELARWLRDNA